MSCSTSALAARRKRLQLASRPDPLLCSLLIESTAQSPTAALIMAPGRPARLRLGHPSLQPLQMPSMCCLHREAPLPGIAQMIASLFENIDLSPSDITAAIILAAAAQQQTRKMRIKQVRRDHGATKHARALVMTMCS